ncbi:putative AMP-binding enzyme [Taphrina deformans PYCC 5710]|uniref:AMP-binding enzyme n=1 Tax=Taphrina deformans (strain PYCC 5710 / ATCC 11124 / CBS 356.35 / IMI 108563 / JCM 9778 / NBRC 8474) TaxID=1097556 RepID=R4X698_TAPDE|nr:putative AMP-binding enzyme [Taphrina deformans PYCC 5710]|eukprot:CCG80519.1 putative AMP-binding enzyme [Taphrina deformans PYCC 5710]
MTSLPSDAVLEKGYSAHDFKGTTKQMGYAIPGSATPGFSAIYKNGMYPDVMLGTDEFKTLTAYDCFARGLSRSAKLNCLGHRPYDPVTKTWGKYQWQTWEEVARRRDAIGAGIVKLHEKSLSGKTKQYCVAIFAKNRPEWAISDLACSSQSLVGVALYDTLGADSTEYIVNHCEAEMIICSLDKIPVLLASKSKMPKLRVLVSMDELDAGEVPGQSKSALLAHWAEEKDVQIMSFSDLERLGEQFPRSHNIPGPDDIWTINYTSGTTGNPKGAILQHRCVPAAVLGSGAANGARANDVVYSCLPLAHCYQRSIDNGMFYAGGSIGYTRGDMLGLVEDMQLLHPTIFASVPRILSRFAAAIRAQTIHAPGVAGAISRTAFAAKKAKMDAGGDNTHILWDKVWSRKIQKIFGGRLRVISSGSAPISSDDYVFLNAALGCTLVNGYGLTETNAAACVALPSDCSVGHCGPPMILAEFKLRSVPSMNYSAEDQPKPRGELLIRSPMNFKEYLKEPTKTAEALTEDGWFCTGDIFSVDSEGRFGMIDRVKNFFKLAQGEYVAPEKIENAMLASGIASQIFVHGNSEESFLVAIAGINPEEFIPFASKVLGREVTATDPATLQAACDDKRVKDAYLAICDRNAQKSKLAGFEKIKRVYLTFEPFTVENDLVTPTMKVKRSQAAKFYKSQIDVMYAEKMKQVMAKL